MAKKPKINSNVFIGKNSLGAEKLFWSRLVYSAYAYDEHPEAVKEGVVKDFWFMENTYYGKVDLAFTPLQVDRDQLVPLRNHEGHTVLPFVKDAFQALERDVRKCLLNGSLKDFPLLRNIKVVESTKDFPRLTSQRLIIFVRFIVQQLKISGKLDSIRNFRDFMPHFESLCLQFAEESPLTKSSLVMSKPINLPYTGLSLSLRDADYSIDKPKVMSYIDHPEFPFYLRLLEKYGFYVDKSAPWRIIANVSSAAMQSYLAQRGVAKGLSPIFSRYYRKAYIGDITLLRYAAYRAYQVILRTRPKINQTTIKNGKVVNKTLMRERPSSVDVFRAYPPEKWLSLYVQIKNKESNLKLRETDMEIIVSDCINLSKTLDMGRIMGYIDIVFKDVPSLEGSYNDFRNRKYFKELPESEYPFTDYQDYLIDTLKKN